MKNKIVVVVGGSKGIGKGIVNAFNIPVISLPDLEKSCIIPTTTIKTSLT